MEAKNFEKAGQVLSEIWSETVIDGHPTVAEYISPSEDEKPILKDQARHMTHVRETQYMLQVVKCMQRSCCDEPRSLYFTVSQRSIAASTTVSSGIRYYEMSV